MYICLSLSMYTCIYEIGKHVLCQIDNVSASLCLTRTSFPTRVLHQQKHCAWYKRLKFVYMAKHSNVCQHVNTHAA